MCQPQGNLKAWRGGFAVGRELGSRQLQIAAGSEIFSESFQIPVRLSAQKLKIHIKHEFHNNRTR